MNYNLKPFTLVKKINILHVVYDRNCLQITYRKLIVNWLYQITFPKVGKHAPYQVLMY